MTYKVYAEKLALSLLGVPLSTTSFSPLDSKKFSVFHFILIILCLQFSSVTQWCPALHDPWTAAHQASLSITNSQSLFKLMSIKSVMPSNHLILCHTLLLLPSIFPSIRVFSMVSVLQIGWPKYWRFSFSISSSSEYSGLVSFRIDWLDVLAI